MASTLCLGADVGTATIVDGKAKLLRGTAWYKLVEGTVVRDSDVLDAPEGAEVQIELVDGGVVSITGPGALYAAAVTPRDARQAAAAELFIPRGWAKFATKANESRLRIRTPLGSVSTANAVAVAHVAPEGIEVFVENGSVKCLDPGKAEAGASDTKAGEFCGRASGKSFAIIGRAPSPFLSALPRQFMDPLPTRAAKFKNATVEPAMDREATLPEVQAWLNSPYRAAFLKRFEPRPDSSWRQRWKPRSSPRRASRIRSHPSAEGSFRVEEGLARGVECDDLLCWVQKWVQVADCRERSRAVSCAGSTNVLTATNQEVAGSSPAGPTKCFICQYLPVLVFRVSAWSKPGGRSFESFLPAT